uniref:Uncharacterized protein n=1 Tax=Tanacetum cinerariifolium TaxID=118510 RepID=A0A699ITP0_TANCI|nr:hypothetical protein [Tanacetum cinerariifolium]
MARYKSSYETQSPSSSPTLLVRKRYRGKSELILDTDSEGDELGKEDTEEYEEDESSDADDEREGQGLDDEGHGLDDEGQGLEDEGLGMEVEEVAPEGQQQAVLVVDTAAGEPLGKKGAKKVSAYRQPTLVTLVDPKDGRVYIDILTYVPPAAHVQTPPSPEWSLGSLIISPSSLVVPSPIASPMSTPATIISRDNHDLRRQLAQVRREQLKLIDRVARIERRQESRGE